MMLFIAGVICGSLVVGGIFIARMTQLVLRATAVQWADLESRRKVLDAIVVERMAKSKGEPIPEDVVRFLAHARALAVLRSRGP